MPSQDSPKRDTWSMLQSQLGLFSSPVKHEQVSMVEAADPQEQAPNNPAMSLEMPVEASPKCREQDTVTVNIDLPVVSETESDSWGTPPDQDADDLFGFGDSGIPKNAFAKPAKPKSFREAGAVAKPTIGDKQPEAEPVVEAETKPAKTETAIDPLLSDELPTSLWQPRKPASIGKMPTTGKPSFSGDVLSSPGAKEKERHSSPREQEATPPPVDDLAKHSSGQKRRERGNDRRGKSDERHENSRRDEPRRDEPRRDLDHHKSHRQNDVPRKKSFGKDAFGMEPFTPVESAIDDLGWEPKPAKGQDRKSTKQTYQNDDASFAFADAEHDWHVTNKEADADKIETPSSRHNRNRNRKPPAAAKPVESVARMPSHFDKPESSAGRSRKEQKPPQTPAREPSPKRDVRPADSPVASTPAKKIVVSNWDDAVRDIIEKNMQRRPTKPERSGGGGSNRGGGRGRGNTR